MWFFVLIRLAIALIWAFTCYSRNAINKGISSLLTLKVLFHLLLILCINNVANTFQFVVDRGTSFCFVMANLKSISEVFSNLAICEPYLGLKDLDLHVSYSILQIRLYRALYHLSSQILLQVPGASLILPAFLGRLFIRVLLLSVVQKLSYE